MRAGPKNLCSVLCTMLCLAATLASYVAFTRSDRELYLLAVVFCLLGTVAGFAVLRRF